MEMEIEEIEELTAKQLRSLAWGEGSDEGVYDATSISQQEEDEDNLEPQDAWWCMGYLDEA